MRPTGALLIVLCFTALFPLISVQGTAAATPTIPSTTDDNLDPVNLIFTGYAPAWWVVLNLNGWNTTPCSEHKTLEGRTYDITLETPNTRGQIPPCYGPRFHVRIWDMGLDPVLGHWSIGAVHYEHTVCNPFCHHAIFGWENAEQQVRSTLALSGSTVSISNYTLPDSGYYQNYYNDGNAALIRLSNPSTYPVRFIETGLRPGTPWSVTLNQTTMSTTLDNIVFSEPNGTYNFTIETVDGYTSVLASGILLVSGNLVSQPVEFTPSASEYYVSFSESGLAPGTAWSVSLDGAAQRSSENTMTFQVSKGTHSFSIQNPQGYTSNPSGGSLDVSSNITVRVSYNTTVQSPLNQPSTAFLIYATVAAWGAVGLAAIIAVIWRRKLGSGDDKTISR